MLRNLIESQEMLCEQSSLHPRLTGAVKIGSKMTRAVISEPSHIFGRVSVNKLNVVLLHSFAYVDASPRCQNVVNMLNTEDVRIGQMEVCIRVRLATTW